MGKDKDFAVDGPVETRKRIGGVVNPDAKTGMVVFYEQGRKEEAINRVFDEFGTAEGVRVQVPASGLSRSFARPEDFPTTSTWVPGQEGRGMQFVRYEMV